MLIKGTLGYMLCFQYKMINTFFLNKKVIFLESVKLPYTHFSFCLTKEETTFHIFFKCCKTQLSWEELRKYFLEDFSLPVLSPQTVIFGFLDYSEHDAFKNAIHECCRC